ncbi:MAG TPA: serine protease [Planktothrix sp.]|jgi:S1-C subfamily serine protease
MKITRVQINRVNAVILAVASATATLSTPGFAYGQTPVLQGSLQVDSNSNTGAGMSSEQLAKQALASTVTLYMYDADGNLAATGTGFFVAKDTLVTNFHVIHNFASGYARFANDRRSFAISSVVATDPQQDLAVLYVPGTNAPSLKLATYQPSIGQAVFVAGSPLGLEGCFSAGTLASIREDGSIQVTAPVSHGNSGSPLLDAQGNVLGVIKSGRSDGNNIGFAAPSMALRLLLSTRF